MNYTDISALTLKALKVAGATCVNRSITYPKELQELLSLFRSEFGSAAASQRLKWMFQFKNYGVSVIKGLGTYGSDEDLWELAVLKRSGESWNVCYDTPITNDVVGFCSEERVLDIVLDVALLDRETEEWFTIRIPSVASWVTQSLDTRKSVFFFEKYLTFFHIAIII